MFLYFYVVCRTVSIIYSLMQGNHLSTPINAFVCHVLCLSRSVSVMFCVCHVLCLSCSVSVMFCVCHVLCLTDSVLYRKSCFM